MTTKNRYYGKLRKNVEITINGYNVDLETYTLLFDKQGGCCAICNKHQNDLPRGLVIDHDHKTNKVRGLLCYSCNSSLGQVKDTIDIVKEKLKIINHKVFLYKQMIEYLQLHPSNLSDNDAKEIYRIKMKRTSKNHSNINSIL